MAWAFVFVSAGRRCLTPDLFGGRTAADHLRRGWDVEQEGHQGADALEEALLLCWLDNRPASLYSVSLALSAVLDGAEVYR